LYAAIVARIDSRASSSHSSISTSTLPAMHRPRNSPSRANR